MPAARPGRGTERRWISPSPGAPLERTLLAVAESVGSAPRGAGVLIEQWIGRPGALVFSRGVPLPGPPAPRPPPPSFLSELWPTAPTVRVAAVFEGPVGPVPPLLPEEAEPMERSPSTPCGRVQTHWLPGPGACVAVRLRAEIVGTPVSAEPVGRSLRARLRWAGGHAVRLEPMVHRRSSVRAFATGRIAGWMPGGPWCVDPIRASRVASALAPMPRAMDPRSAHSVVIGASGSGKTTFLAESAVRALERGTGVVVVDVHGDLAPAVAAGTSPAMRERIVALDPTVESAGSVGVRLVPRRGEPGSDRAVAQLVAALRRISSDGRGEVYWGFRMERLFDAFLRIVREEDGDLADLWELLTDGRRRDAARLTVTDPDLARFLEEIATLLKRLPDLLWPATARIAKLVTSPALRRLLAPTGATLDLDAELRAHRPVLIRVPIGELGPEAASFAATLLVGRIYFAHTVRPPDLVAPTGRTLLLLDEAHAIAPTLLAEILAEGRKFGVEVLAATQYVERLQPEVRAAAEGAVGRHIVFRTPPPGARAAGSWVGLDPTTAVSVIPTLPIGEALVASADDPIRLRGARMVTATPRAPGDWTAVVARTAAAYGATAPSGRGPDPGTALVEQVLFELLGVGERGEGFDLGQLVRQVASRSDAAADAVLAAVEAGRRRGWVLDGPGRLVLSEGGARFLGWGAATGATRESAEHRALLFEAFRLFARHGSRLELVRQGGFEHRLPDARLRVLSEAARRLPPDRLAQELAQLRSGWLWRCFGGRDVHVEAEVSGSIRPERVRRGVEKARAAGAFALFLTADARRANRVRRVLHDERLVPTRAQVWTLRRAAVVRPPSSGGKRETPAGFVRVRSGESVT
ncbi:MAG TPA: hypothetical protein VFF67_00480 [Thermoplasmata archaeon]|nr:hypothetical protein [Thermoplasmata archaeon]